MDDSNYMKYNYHTSINQDNTTNSLNIKELDYNLGNNDQFSNIESKVIIPNLRIRNKHATR